MPTWLMIVAGVLCLLWALQQFRITLVYMGIMQSAVVAGPQPSLIHIALEKSLAYAGFAIALFAVRWPHVVTYLLGVLLLKALVHLVQSVLQVGQYGIVQLTAKGRAQAAAIETGSFVFYAVAVAVSAHFLGF